MDALKGMVAYFSLRMGVYLTPCMVIDHPQVLRGIVKKYGAKPVIEGAEELIENRKMVNFLDNYSKRIKQVMDPVWEKDYLDNPNSRWYRHGEAYRNLGKNSESSKKIRKVKVMAQAPSHEEPIVSIQK